MYNFRIPVVVLDCEMSGLEPEDHQLIQISAVKCDPRNLKILDTFNSFVGPSSGNILDLEKNSDVNALNKSSYHSNKEKIRSSPQIESVLTNLFKWLPLDYVLSGYNLELDIKFLEHYSKQNFYFSGVKFPKISYKRVDLSTFVEFYSSKHGTPADIHSKRLEDVCQTLNLVVKPAHDSLNDCHMALDLLRYFLKNTVFTGEKND
jgi:DNA polymerase III alpha subunit (gram-positive type)